MWCIFVFPSVAAFGCSWFWQILSFVGCWQYIQRVGPHVEQKIVQFFLYRRCRVDITLSWGNFPRGVELRAFMSSHERKKEKCKREARWISDQQSSSLIYSKKIWNIIRYTLCVSGQYAPHLDIPSGRSSPLFEVHDVFILNTHIVTHIFEDYQFHYLSKCPPISYNMFPKSLELLSIPTF